MEAKKERKKKGKKKRERKRMIRKLNLGIYGKCNNELSLQA